MNQPWTYDSYSPIDLTILDWHFGDLELWREAVEQVHSRGMYIILDNTFATMGDLIGFEGYLNTSAPFVPQEHSAVWKSDRKYWDFDMSQEYNETCQYPRFWLETGFPAGSDVTDQLKGCHAGEFDQYGDTEAFGVYPDWYVVGHMLILVYADFCFQQATTDYQVCQCSGSTTRLARTYEAENRELLLYDDRPVGH